MAIDRQYLDADMRVRLIDIASSQFETPLPGIYDEPVRWYKANEQWAKLIEGLLYWLTEITAWKDAEDENHPGIQGILEFIEGIAPEDINVPLTDSDKELICSAIKCAAIDILQGAVAGANGDLDFTIDDDGNLIIGDGLDDIDGGDITNATIAQQIYGGCLEIMERVNEYIQDYDDFYISTGASVSLMEKYLISKYVVSADITDAVSDYKIWRDVSGVELGGFLEPFARWLFCEGRTKQAINAWVIDTNVEIEAYLDIFEPLLQEQIDQWFQKGIDIPRLGYEQSACYRYPPASYIMDYTNFNSGFVEWDTRGITNHKIRAEIRVIAPFVDSDGDIYDGVYYDAIAATPATTYKMRLVADSGNYSTTDSPAYLNGSGTYVLEYDVVNTLTGTWFNNIPSFVPVSGSIEITLIDLGAL